MNAAALLLALLSAIANAFATVCLRQAAFAQPLFGTFTVPLVSRTVPDWYVLALISYGLAFVLYALALQRAPASIAYPVIVGAAYLIILAVTALLFAESPTRLQMAGGVLIAAGIAITSLSSS